MIPIPILLRGSAAALLTVLAAAACSERGAAPLSPADTAPPSASSVVLARLECRVEVASGRVSCADAPSTGDARALITGGQGTYFLLTNSNLRTVADTSLFDVTVKNLIPQALATTDGVTGTATGVRAFISSVAVTSGTGSVEAVRYDGIEVFTAPGQPYYQYSGSALGSDGILATNETSSAKTWGFRKDATVNSYVFGVLLATDVRYPNGWIDVSPQPAAVLTGGTRALTATVRSVIGSTMSETVTWSSSNTSVATVNASGVITGVAAGTATITASSGGGARTGSTTAVVCPVLSVGGVYTTDGPVTHLCLGGAGAEYTVAAQSHHSAAVPLTLLGTGIGSVSGAPTPTRLPAPRTAGWTMGGDDVNDVETTIRRREAEVLRPLMARARELRARSGGPRFILVPGTPVVGDLMTLNAHTGTCSGSDPRGARVEAVGTHVVVMADTTNPSGGLSSSDYASVAAQFDTLVWPTLTTPFGAPYDLDGNGDRVVVFYTRALNTLSASGAAPVAGLTLQRDLYSSTLCGNSNQGELIYLMAADPSGTINGNARTVAEVKALAARTMGHELQHVVNASRRLYVNSASVFEESWLDEGLSDVAEELLYYAAAGVSPRSNLSYGDINLLFARRQAWTAFQEPNITRLREWLRAPHATSDPVGTRGATWGILRYAADRKGGVENSFWYALVNSTTAGMANLGAVAGVDVRYLSRDASAALYADDALTGVAAVYTNPSWNLRSIYGGLDYNGDAVGDGYPLLVHDLANNVARVDTLGASGGVAYTRLGVDSGGIATLTFTVNGAAPGSETRLAVIRRK